MRLGVWASAGIAPATNGHAAAVLPKPVRNSRRRIARLLTRFRASVTRAPDLALGQHSFARLGGRQAHDFLKWVDFRPGPALNHSSPRQAARSSFTIQ